MSATQVRWLTDHLSQGKITREEFASLYHRIIASQQDTGDVAPQTQTGKRRVKRLHPVTRRILAQIRVFKMVARGAKYFLVLGLIAGLYITWDTYQQDNAGVFNADAIKSSLSRSLEKPLPADMRLAAHQLADQSNWYTAHIQQFNDRWAALNPEKQKQYQQEEWYRSFSLALALQTAEQRALAKSGNRDAIYRSQALVTLSQTLENAPGT